MRYSHRYFLLAANGRKEKRFGICCACSAAEYAGFYRFMDEEYPPDRLHKSRQKQSPRWLFIHEVTATETMLKVNKNPLAENR